MNRSFVRKYAGSFLFFMLLSSFLISGDALASAVVNARQVRDLKSQGRVLSEETIKNEHGKFVLIRMENGDVAFAPASSNFFSDNKTRIFLSLGIVAILLVALWYKHKSSSGQPPPLQYTAGFTLVELLIVIAIIGILSTMIVFSLSRTQLKARDVARAHDLRVLQTALELYRADYDEYPKTFEPTGGLSVYRYCEGHATDYIPGLVPKYISRLPGDPSLNCAGVPHAWSYASNGIDYKLVTHPEGNFSPGFTDPSWDQGSDPCVLDGPVGAIPVHYGFWSAGAVCWSI
ncbi:MAG: prepilin-type N-terminal cleavage/methylation domain-containing protein [bacterium]|nr:prepilin-type N-terminal cleavage/methylation domain-containing protein [bacterium]